MAKRLLSVLLHPPLALLLLLIPLSAILLVYALSVWDSGSLWSAVSYVLSAYTLTVWAVRAPGIVRRLCSRVLQGRLASRYIKDVRFRMTVTLYASFMYNAAYALLQLGIGLYHSAYWYFAVAVYYMMLGSMRFFLLRHTRRYLPGERKSSEYARYFACGWVFLFMNLTLTGMMIPMIAGEYIYRHDQITVIAMAAYTFTAFAAAVVGMVRYRRYRSPVYSAAKCISMAAASVSMIILESTMLSVFGSGMPTAERRLLLALTGGAVSLFLIIMSVYIITAGRRSRRGTEQTNETR